MVKIRGLLFVILMMSSCLSYGQDYKGFELHTLKMSDYTTLNLYVDYSINEEGLIRIDSVYGNYTGWVFNLYFVPVDYHIVQNWDELTGQMVWEQTFTTGIGKSYESALFNQMLLLEGTLEVRGANTESMEIVSIINSNPKFDVGVRVFYFLFVSHILLMIVSALVTLFQTKYGSVRKLIISALFPFIGPAIYLGVGLYKLIKHIVFWAKGLRTPTTE